MRGPSYTEDENKLLERLAKDKSLTHAQRIQRFMEESTGENRTEDAISQKLRKLAGEGKTKAVKKATKPAPKNGNGNGHEPSKTLEKLVAAADKSAITIELNGVTLSGSPKAVGTILSQLEG
jgi:hypothetical protein